MKTRKNWPFKDMAIGDVVMVRKDQGGIKGQAYVHVYARLNSKRFKTWSDGAQVGFERMPDPA